MKVYRVSVTDSCAEHKGYSFHTNRGAVAKAEGEARANGHETTWREIDVEISKSGIVKALNTWAGHADNG